MSFLEMLDVLNEQLILDGEEPVAFDHDCREGICGIVRDDHQRRRARPAAGHHDLPAAHAALQGRRHDRHRAVAGPGVPGDQGPGRRPRAFDRIIQAGGYITVNTGAAPEAHATPVPKDAADAPSTPPPASAAAPAWRPARTALDAVHRRQGHPPRPAPAGPARAGHPGVNMVAQHDEPTSAAAPTSASAPRPARRTSRWRRSRSSTTTSSARRSRGHVRIRPWPRLLVHTNGRFVTIDGDEPAVRVSGVLGRRGRLDPGVPGRGPPAIRSGATASGACSGRELLTGRSDDAEPAAERRSTDASTPECTPTRTEPAPVLRSSSPEEASRTVMSPLPARTDRSAARRPTAVDPLPVTTSVEAVTSPSVTSPAPPRTRSTPATRRTLTSPAPQRTELLAVTSSTVTVPGGPDLHLTRPPGDVDRRRPGAHGDPGTGRGVHRDEPAAARSTTSRGPRTDSRPSASVISTAATARRARSSRSSPGRMPRPGTAPRSNPKRFSSPPAASTRPASPRSQPGPPSGSALTSTRSSPGVVPTRGRRRPADVDPSGVDLDQHVDRAPRVVAFLPARHAHPRTQPDTPEPPWSSSPDDGRSRGSSPGPGRSPVWSPVWSSVWSPVGRPGGASVPAPPPPATLSVSANLWTPFPFRPHPSWSAPCTAWATHELSDMPCEAAACSAWPLIWSTRRRVIREMSPVSAPQAPRPAG